MLKRKCDSLDVLKTFKWLAKKQSGHNVQVLRTDGEGEYTSV